MASVRRAAEMSFSTNRVILFSGGMGMRFSIFFVTALLFVTAAYAAVLTCDSVTTLSQLIAAGATGCTHQDKLFNNFAYTGEQVGSVQVVHEFTASPTGTTDIHGWLFSLQGGWTTTFNLQ